MSHDRPVRAVPQMPALSEADAADAEGFLSDMLLSLSVVGVSLFDKAKAGGASSRDLFLKAKGIEARGMDGSEGFVVRAGSQVVKDEVGSIHAYLADLRGSLPTHRVLEPAGLGYRVTEGLHLRLTLHRHRAAARLNAIRASAER